MTDLKLINRGLKGLLFILLLAVMLMNGEGRALSAEKEPQSATPYRTPRAGEGFTADVFGHEITVKPEDRRSVSAWDLGLGIYKPTPQDAGIFPFGGLYFWRHPDNRYLLRAEVSGLENDVFLSRSPQSLAPFEWVLTFTNSTVPFSRAELVDGRALKSEELLWGYVRPGFGLGYRKQVAPGFQENMLAIDLTIEPGFLFFDKDSKTAGNFVVPRNTFELRSHLQLRWDAVERNLLELPHRGTASGADLVYGYRPEWKNWGPDGSQNANDGRNYLLFTGYFLAAGGVPGVDSDRHRLIGSVHGGVGSHLDRFSSPRIGGGVLPMGEEYGSTSEPVLPGTAAGEFFPRHYLAAVGEYRWEPVFFTYLSVDASAGWLDRLRQTGTGVSRKDNVFSSLGARVTTGFFFDTRLQLAYNYNFSAIRKGSFGGHELVLNLSRNF